MTMSPMSERHLSNDLNSCQKSPTLAQIAWSWLNCGALLPDNSDIQQWTRTSVLHMSQQQRYIGLWWHEVSPVAYLETALDIQWPGSLRIYTNIQTTSFPQDRSGNECAPIWKIFHSKLDLSTQYLELDDWSEVLAGYSPLMVSSQRVWSKSGSSVSFCRGSGQCTGVTVRLTAQLS